MQFQKIHGAKCWNSVAMCMKTLATMTVKVFYALGVLVGIRPNNNPKESALKRGEARL